MVIMYTRTHHIQCQCYVVTCDHVPTEVLRDRVRVVKESHIPKLEGEFITYTCPSGSILTGPNVSVCTGNREWEPDPRLVECIGDYR